jgi:chemotaxis protein MotB
MIDKKQPIIIKKGGHGEHGHHGGAWKVAFADFVTAMMAFFLLLWLIGGTSDEEKAALSEYFNNPSATQGTAATQAPSSVNGPGGASTSLIQLSQMPMVKMFDKRKEADFKQKVEKDAEQEKKVTEAQKEKQLLDDLEQKLKKAIEQSQALKPFKDQLLLDITPEGLRIQIVDKENRPMFDSGKAELKYYTVDILFELARFIREVPNRISITGHTDAARFVGRDNYSNWELSADRANAARRALVDGGMLPRQIGRVVGLASSALFDKADPYNPINRRISIIVMNKKTEAAISAGEGVNEKYLSNRRDAKRGQFTELPMDILEPGASDINLDQ